MKYCLNMEVLLGKFRLVQTMYTIQSWFCILSRVVPTHLVLIRQIEDCDIPTF
jgi:hypothetical protein